MAAFFLAKSGGKMAILKLMKLLYLADRESLNRYEEPISGDRMVSMPHGPVLSRTYELMNGAEGPVDDGWDHWVADRAGYEVALKDDISADRESLGALSDAEIEVLDSVWTEFGHLGKYQIRDLTHDTCAEWTDPHGSSKPIPYRDVFLALGRDLEAAREAESHLKASNAVDALFASL
ncbi:Panacea domain-containing protein [Paraburkholderia sp.]|uniref:Panacea domain-containing protein n=1 Tax=Paraburkholderia sp. TaxID=1926495 RepID=UPI0039E263E0